MNSTKKGMNRNDSGQFLASLDKVCKCGRRMGQHSAEFPYSFDEDDGGPDCEAFSKASPST